MGGHGGSTSTVHRTFQRCAQQLQGNTHSTRSYRQRVGQMKPTYVCLFSPCKRIIGLCVCWFRHNPLTTHRHNKHNVGFASYRCRNQSLAPGVIPSQRPWPHEHNIGALKQSSCSELPCATERRTSGLDVEFKIRLREHLVESVIRRNIRIASTINIINAKTIRGVVFRQEHIKSESRLLPSARVS